MAVIELNRNSTSLGKTSGVTIVLPDQIKGNVKILYLLHGLGDNHTKWLTNSRVARYAENRNLAVVMPDGEKSFYCKMVDSEDYYEYIGTELQEYVESILPFSGDPEDRYIAGLSMGGYGAMKFALSKPERYAGVATFSGVMDIKKRVEGNTFSFGAIFPDGHVPDTQDLFYLAQKADLAPKKPKIYQWCGTEDFLFEDNLEFHHHLEKLSFDAVWSQTEGNHDWAKWDEHLLISMDLFQL